MSDTKQVPAWKNVSQVDSFNLFGTSVRQNPCGVMDGAPDETTKGVVGALIVDTSAESKKKDMWKCIAVFDKGSIIKEGDFDCVEENIGQSRETAKYQWNKVGSSSTEIVTERPENPDEDVDYIVNDNGVYLFYKWIKISDTEYQWTLIAGSVAEVVDELPAIGNTYTDYYKPNKTRIEQVEEPEGSGNFVDKTIVESYFHYRWIGDDFVMISADSYSIEETQVELEKLKEDYLKKISELGDSFDKRADKIEENILNLETNKLTYDVSYGGAQGKNIFAFYEYTNGVETNKKTFEISGGGGAGGVSINYTSFEGYQLDTYYTSSDEPIFKYNLEAKDGSGDDIKVQETWTIRRKDEIATQAKEFLTREVSPGTGLSVEIPENYRKLGDYVLSVVGTDITMTTVSPKTWYLHFIELELNLQTLDSNVFSIQNSLSIAYDRKGAVQKKVYFYLDDMENPIIIDVQSANESGVKYQVIDRSYASRGSDTYYLKVQLEALDGKVKTTPQYLDIMWADKESTDIKPLLSVETRDYKIKQYETAKIEFSAYDCLSDPAKVDIYEDEDSEPRTFRMVSQGEKIDYDFTSSVVGQHTVKLKCINENGETEKLINIIVEPLDINVDPLTDNLVFDFDPTGKSNNNVNDRYWEYINSELNTTIKLTPSKDFDWDNGGYKYDKEGIKYFCIKAGSSITINHKMFSSVENTESQGKNFKFIFKTVNSATANPKFLNCVELADNLKNAIEGYYYHEKFYSDIDYTISIPEEENQYYFDKTNEKYYIYKTEDVTPGYYEDSIGIKGIEMRLLDARVYADLGSYLSLPYSTEDKIEFELNINPKNSPVPMIMGYEDGVSTTPLLYENGSLTQITGAEDITIGSSDCDVWIYRLKVYNRTLSDEELLKNFIADAPTVQEKIKRHDRNQIYDNNGKLDPMTLALKCPWLRVITIEAPQFTNDKDNRVGGTKITHIYKNGDPLWDNWVAEDCAHSGQGTSSNDYGAAGRNLDLMLKKTKHKVTGQVVNPSFKGISLGYGTLEEDEMPLVKKVSLTDKSVPVDYFNVKVNIASSENANNALLQRLYNENNPYDRPIAEREVKLTDIFAEETIEKMSEEDKEKNLKKFQAQINNNIKDTMEFYNCVIFVKETDTVIENGIYANHREFNNTDFNFYAIGNIGDSKKTDDTRLNDPDDQYECINEITDVGKPLSDFPKDTKIIATGDWLKDVSNFGLLYEYVQNSYVRTPDFYFNKNKTYYINVNGQMKVAVDYAKTEYLGELFELINGEYIKTEDNEIVSTKIYFKDIDGEMMPTVDFLEDKNFGVLYEKNGDLYFKSEDSSFILNKTYYVDILEQETFDKKYTYEWRYIWEGKDDKENKEVANYCKRKWIEFYRFVTESTNINFQQKLSDYMVIDSALYYYLFTERYTMVDNRAKNSFWHYGKVADDNGNYIWDESINDYIRKWDLCFDYDNDTALGIDNDGDMVYRYGLEDTDVDENGTEIFRESDSTFFCRLRDLFKDKMQQLYQQLSDGNKWNSTNLIYNFDQYQEQFPEELWRIDIKRKYIRTYTESFINGLGWKKGLTTMAHGKKKYQRRQFERNQDIYMESKYEGAKIRNDKLTIRCKTILGEQQSGLFARQLKLSITPSSYFYLRGSWASSGGTMKPRRLSAGKPVTFTAADDGINITNNEIDIVNILGVSNIQSLGDISLLYPTSVEGSTAYKLQDLLIGNETKNFTSPYFTKLSLTISENEDGLSSLLKILNLTGLSDFNELNAKDYLNLETIKAKGSGLSVVQLPASGKLRIIELPAISTLKMKNQKSFEVFDIGSASGKYNIKNIIAEDCFIDPQKTGKDQLTSILLNSPLERVRLTNVNWILEDDSLLEKLYPLLGFNVNWEEQNIDAVLTGKITINSVVGASKLRKYREKWKNLNIIASEGKETTVNYHYYDKNGNEQIYSKVLDRSEKTYIPDPFYNKDKELPSDLDWKDNQYIYTFGTYTNGKYNQYSGWRIQTSWDDLNGQDLNENSVTGSEVEINIYANYQKETVTYIVRWYENETKLDTDYLWETKDVPYGKEVIYGKKRTFLSKNDLPEEEQGQLPTYDGDSFGNYKFFVGWNKNTGYITNGDNGSNILRVYGLWTTVELPTRPVDYKYGDLKLQEMTHEQILAIAASGQWAKYFSAETDVENTNIRDYVDIVMGQDFNFSNTTFVEPIPLQKEGQEKLFHYSETGKEPFDTGYTLLDGKQSFTLVIDYRFLNTPQGTIFSCYDDQTKKGFKLIAVNSNTIQLQWYGITKTYSLNTIRERNIIVVRFNKEEPTTLYVYSHVNGSQYSFIRPQAKMIAATSQINEDATLILGAYKDATAIGSPLVSQTEAAIYWCKIWFDDLGENNSFLLSNWPREVIRMDYWTSEAYKIENQNNYANACFICNNGLSKNGQLDSEIKSTTWNNLQLSNFLNERFYNGLPLIWQDIIKKVQIKTTKGNKQTDIEENTYSKVYIPAVAEVCAFTSNSSNNVSSGAAMNALYKNERSNNKMVSWHVIAGSIGPNGMYFYGLKQPKNATIHSSSLNADPTTNPGLSVQEGDLYAGTGILPNDKAGSFIYVSQDTAYRLGLVPSGNSIIAAQGEQGGVWRRNSGFLTRSPNLNDENQMCGVGQVRIPYDWSSTTASQIIPMFSI